MAEQTLTGVTPSTAKRKKAPWFNFGDQTFAYILNAPAMFLILALVAYPVVNSFWSSFHLFNLRRPKDYKFIGLDNYIEIVQTELFWESLRVTAIFTVGTTISVLVMSLALAIVANEPIKERPILRMLILLPWAVPGVVNALMWKWIFNPRVGVLNGLFFSFGWIDEYRSWLMEPSTMYPSIILANLWNNLPFATIVFLAALQAIPQDLYDAALVDRANIWNRFRHVTLPWLIHPILIVLILQTMGGLRLFDIIYLLTGGGPGYSTTTIGFASFQTAFYNMDFGLGNAYSYIIALLTLVLAALYMRMLYRRGEIKV